MVAVAALVLFALCATQEIEVQEMHVKTSLLVALSACASFLLPACSSSYDYEEYPNDGSSSSYETSANANMGTTARAEGVNTNSNNAVYMQQGMEVSAITARMADTLQQNMFYHLLPDAPVDRTSASGNVKIVTMPRIAITSFVDTDTYEDSGYLGRALAEFFTHELSTRAFDVTEYKLTGKLSVSKDGDYIFSRDWKKIARDTKVKYLLGGTITRNNRGVVVVARIINMQTRQSIATATDFIPYNLLPSCYRTATKNCSFAGVAGYLDPVQIKKVNYYQTTEQQQTPKIAALRPIPANQVATVSTTQALTRAQVVSSSGKPLGGVFVTTSEMPADPHVVAQYSSDSVFDSGSDALEIAAKSDPRYRNGVVVGATSRGNYDRYRQEIEDSGTFGRCNFEDCNDPVVYPANTYMHNTLLVRDTADESSYGRVSN